LARLGYRHFPETGEWILDLPGRGAKIIQKLKDQKTGEEVISKSYKTTELQRPPQQATQARPERHASGMDPRTINVGHSSFSTRNDDAGGHNASQVASSSTYHPNWMKPEFKKTNIGMVPTAKFKAHQKTHPTVSKVSSVIAKQTKDKTRTKPNKPQLSGV
jgi:hypothetical protein